MKTSFLIALGLMLVLEGIMPLVAPESWRQTFERMLRLSDGQLRFIGAVSMLAGLLLILCFTD